MGQGRDEHTSSFPIVASPAGGKDGGPQAAETTSIFQLPPGVLQ